MYVVVCTSIIAIVLTYLASINRLPNGLKYAFGILAFIGVIHYDYGNDYMVYLRDYNDIVSHQFDFDAIMEKEVFRNPGWAILCYLFFYLGGFFSLVAVLNVFLNYVYYQFISHYVERRYWPLSVFLYVTYSSLYLLNFSMMRQGLTIALFVFSWQFMKERKWLTSLIIYLIAVQMHTSALVLLPFAFFGFLAKINGKFVAVLFGAIFVVLFKYGNVVNEILTIFMGIEDVETYVKTYEDISYERTYGLGFVLSSIPFFVSLWYLYNNKTAENHKSIILVIISCLGAFVAPFADMLPMLGRMSFYFGAYTIAAVPLTYNSIKNKNVQCVLLFLLVLLHVYSYIFFFSSSSVYGKAYAEFHTIFEVL